MKKMKKKVLMVVFVVIGLSANTQTIVTDRPDQTESSTTVPSGSFQTESGVLVGFTDIDNSSERQILLPTNLFRIGISKGIELRVLSQFESIENKTLDETFSGISDLEVGAKVQLFKKEEANTEIAFLSHLIIPSGSKDLTIDKIGAINKLSISHSISKSVGIGYNVGYNYLGIGSGDLTYSFSIGIGITEKLGAYMEPYGDLVDFEEHTSNFDAGFTYLIQDNFQFDFSFGTGINHSMNYLALGCSLNIAKQNNQQP
jgi:hypothetical protein